MYAIISPCVYDQSLRAEGITTPADCDAFSRSRERCLIFTIKTISYRCPEACFFGKARPPRSFSEMNTQQFSLFLDEVEAEILADINRFGEPAAIIGVDSSPTCGIRYTYQTSIKEPGRGALIKRFPDIRGIDVKVFSRYHTLLITHPDEPVQPLIEYLTAGSLLVTRYDASSHIPPLEHYDLCVCTDSLFFSLAKRYCSEEYIVALSDIEALSVFMLSAVLHNSVK